MLADKTYPATALNLSLSSPESLSSGISSSNRSISAIVENATADAIKIPKQITCIEQNNDTEEEASYIATVTVVTYI